MNNLGMFQFRRWALWLLIFCFAQLAYAADKLSFWTVKANGATVHILGSIHAGKASFYPLPDNITKAFESADYLVLEVASSDDYQPVVELTAGKTIYSLLQAKTQAALKAYLQPYQANPDTQRYADKITQLKPWMATTMIQMVELGKIGFDPNLGIDWYFEQQAQRLEKPILALETTKQQMDALQGIAYASNLKARHYSPKLFQDLTLLATLQAIPTITEDMQQLEHAWQTGQAEKIYQLIHDSLKIDGQLDKAFQKQFMTLLYVDRNQRMLNKIMQYFSTQKVYFVVVGAAHMGGQAGIITQLIQKGYTVIQHSADR